MKKNILLIAGGLAGLGLALVALPSGSATPQGQNESMRLAEAHAQEASERAVAQSQAAIQKLESMLGQEVVGDTLVIDDEGPSWLGVETREVTSDTAKELKLPAERGVVVGRITSDSPAAKAGLKEKDVITEVNGQRVEGSAQFRRMIHEIPAGRAAQLTLWRDGRTQTLSATLGKAEERHNRWMGATPGAFAFRMPDVQIPEMPSIDLGEEMGMLAGGRPRLGIDAEDLGGQLGSFFGAPDGEGILVRSVTSGSAAEKAGLKAGDVITSFNGERVRSLGDLRQKLASQSESTTAKIGVLRNRSEATLSVELPAGEQKAQRKIMQRTNI